MVESPKSDTLRLNSLSKRIFSGLRSRCATPTESRYSIALTNIFVKLLHISAGNLPYFATKSNNSPPSANSKIKTGLVNSSFSGSLTFASKLECTMLIKCLKLSFFKNSASLLKDSALDDPAK